MKKAIFQLAILLFLSHSNLWAERVPVANNKMKTRSGFTENKGQFRDQYGNPNPDVLYVADFGGMKVLIRKDGFSYETYEVRPQWVDPATIPYKILTYTPEGDTIESWPGKEDARKNLMYHFHRIDVDFLNANINTGISKGLQDQKTSRSRILFLDRNGETANIETYESIKITDIYNGIDITFYSQNKSGDFKYDFIVHPGADVTAIEMQFNGQASIYQDELDNLYLSTQFGDIKESIPLCFTENSKGKRTIIDGVHYVLHDKRVTFRGIESPLKDKLVIDPAVSLYWAITFGGDESDGSTGSAVDQYGNAYVVGNTKSSQNIATTGVYQDSLLIEEDGYLAKFSRTGELQWSTYLNASPSVDIDYKNTLVVLARDRIIKFDTSGNFIWQMNSMNGLKALCQDNEENIIAVGDTLIYYPSGDSLYHNDTIIKYNSQGIIQWARGYGGKETLINDVGVDGSGNIYIAGITKDSTGIATSNAHMPSYNGTNYSYAGHNYWLSVSLKAGDGYFAKLDPSGNLIYGSYYGGQYFDVINNIKVANDGRFVIAGETNSRSGIATPGVYQDSLNRQGKVCFTLIGIGFDFNCENDGWPLIDTCIIGSYCMQPYDYRCQSTDAFIGMFNNDGIRKWGTYYGDNLSEYSTQISISQDLDTISIAGNSRHTCFDYPNDCPPNQLATSYYSLYNSGETYIAQFDTIGRRLWGTYVHGEDIDSWAGPFWIVSSVDQNKDELILYGSTSENDLLIPLNSFIDRLAVAAMDTIIFPRYLSVCVGDTINETIDIQSSINQGFEIFWFKDDSIISHLINSANFYFQADMEDEGWYYYQIKTGNFNWMDSVYLAIRNTPDFDLFELNDSTQNFNNILFTADINFDGALDLITSDRIIYNNHMSFNQIDTLQLSYPEVSIIDLVRNEKALIFNNEPYLLLPNDNIKRAKLFEKDSDTVEIIENELLNGITLWADFNNDGNREGFKVFYTNETGGFFRLVSIGTDSIYEINAGLSDYGHWANCLQKTVSGDFDNDGDVDILFIGSNNIECNWINTISVLVNNNGLFSKNSLPMLEQGNQMDAHWFDMNADGNLDIIFSKSHYTGEDAWGNKIIQVFHSADNTYSLHFSDTIVLPSQQQETFLKSVITDIDLDGYLDIVFGKQLYLQTENSYEKVTSTNSEAFTGITENIIGTGDFQRNSISFLVSKNGIYENHPCNPINIPPSAPEGLTFIGSNDSITFFWQRSTDLETPQLGLTYNLRVGTSPGGNEIMSSLSDSTGWRRLVGMGNVFQNTSWQLHSLPPGTYYWSVQAIDNSFAGGPFAPEQSFIVEDYTLKRLSTNVFLEGAFNPGSLSMNNSLLVGNLIPIAQPYSSAPWNYNGEETITSMPEGVIDWVLVELRQAASAELATEATIIEGWPKALLLKADGSIVGADNKNPLIGETEITENLYIVIRHRNHLDVMSSAPLILSGNTYSYDFTDDITKAYGGAAGYKQIGTGIYGMVAGDGDAEGSVYMSDRTVWRNSLGVVSSYETSDYDMDGNSYMSDRTLWRGNLGVTNPLSQSVNAPLYKSQVPGDSVSIK